MSMIARIVRLSVMLLLWLNVHAAYAQEAAGRAGEDDCRALMTTGSAAEPGSDTPTIHIVEPADGTTIYGRNVTVRVEPEHFTIGEGRHWHLWVDGQLQGMIYDDGALLDLAPGTHRLCAVLGDAQHMDLGIPDGVTITVAQAAAGTPTANASARYAPPQPEGGPLNPLVVVAAGLLAAGGGWWVGRHLSKRGK